MQFWMMLVVVMKHLYNSGERQGSSGEEEGDDIFQIMWWMKNDSHASSENESSDLYLFLTV